IDGEQRPLEDDTAINLRVAIGDPALAIGTDAGEAVIFAAAPDRVGIEEPERRGKSSGGQVDVDVGLLQAQFADQMNGRVKVTVELTALDHLVGVACAIELELID